MGGLTVDVHSPVSPGLLRVTLPEVREMCGQREHITYCTEHSHFYTTSQPVCLRVEQWQDPPPCFGPLRVGEVYSRVVGETALSMRHALPRLSADNDVPSCFRMDCCESFDSGVTLRRVG